MMMMTLRVMVAKMTINKYNLNFISYFFYFPPFGCSMFLHLLLPPDLQALPLSLTVPTVLAAVPVTAAAATVIRTTLTKKSCSLPP